MKIDRLIGILSILLKEEKSTASELAERFEVSRRTIKRERAYVWGWCSDRKDYRLHKNKRRPVVICTLWM